MKLTNALWVIFTCVVIGEILAVITLLTSLGVAYISTLALIPLLGALSIELHEFMRPRIPKFKLSLKIRGTILHQKCSKQGD